MFFLPREMKYRAIVTCFWRCFTRNLSNLERDREGNKGWESATFIRFGYPPPRKTTINPLSVGYLKHLQ